MHNQHTQFSIGPPPPPEEIPSLANNGLNWKHANEETSYEALKQEIELNHAEHSILVSDLLNQNRDYASETKLDGAVKIIQNYLEMAAAKSVPAQCLVSWSKPWWTKELTTAYKDLRDSREVLKGWMREFHCPSLFLADIVAQKRKKTLKLVQKSKQDFY